MFESIAVAIPVTHPFHGERKTIFVAAPGRKVEEAIGANQVFKGPRVARIGMKDLPLFIPNECTQPRCLTHWERNTFAVIVVGRAIRNLLVAVTDMKIAIEVAVL